MSMPFEVFFSYAQEDEDWLKKIEKYLSTLQRQNYIQGWHGRNILAGSEWEREILTRLNTAPIILLLVSQDFVASDFCWGVELEQAMQRHEAGAARVIPIIVRPADWHDTPFTKLQFLPQDGKPLSTYSNEDEALLQVAQGLRRVVEQMRGLPQATRSSTTEGRTNTPIVHQPWNIPLLRNPFFTGRENLLTRLRTSLMETHTMALSQPQAISGLGGIGKTQVALEYAYRYRSDYQAVLWVKASTQEELAEDIAALARILNLPGQRVRDQRESISAVRQWLARHAGWLLIFDNADDLSPLSEYLPLEPKGHILLTTRAHAMGGIAQKMEVAPMDEAEGVHLLLHRARLIDRKTAVESLPAEMYQQATAIFHLLGGLPLALDQAGAYIEETHESLSNYIDLYQTQRKDLLERRGGIRSDHLPVATTWALAFQTIEQSNPAAIELMRLCAFLAPDAIPEEMILEGDEYLSPLLQSITEDRTRWNNTLADLLKYSLIQRNQMVMSLSIHRLLQAVIKDEMDAQQQEEWETCVVRVMGDVFPVSVDKDNKGRLAPWIQNQAYLPHALHATEYVANRAMTFSEAIDLLDSVGSYLYERGQYNQAEPLLQRQLSIHERIFGPEHPETAHSLNSLALFYYIQDKNEQAEQLFQRALTIYEHLLGPDHSDIAMVLNNLANLYADQDKNEQAEQFYQRALVIRERLLGPDHPDTANTIYRLANLYDKQDKSEQAEQLFQRALMIYEHLFGPDHPDTVDTLDRLANLYYEQGKYKQAEPLFQRSLAAHERITGSDHPDITSALNNLADLYKVQAKYDQSEQLYQRSLTISEQAFGPNHSDTVAALNSLANLYAAQDKYKQAESFYQRALTICEQELGPDHPDAVYILSNLANLYTDQYEFDQAKPLHKRTLAIYERVFGPDHPKTAKALRHLADLYYGDSRYRRARRLYQRVLAIQERVLGSEHPDIVGTLEGLAELYKRKGKYKEAEQFYRRALMIQEKVLGPEHPETARILNNFAVFYRYRSGYKNKCEQAESLCQRALTIQERAFGPDHPETAHALWVLADIYADQGKYEQAEPLYQRALAIRERVLGPDHRDTVRVCKAYQKLQRRKNRRRGGLFSFFFKKRG